MTTKNCTNGHTMTGIGFDECPECEAPWKIHTDDRIEEIIEEAKSLSIQLEAEGGWNIPYEGIYEDKMIDWLRTAFTTYGQSRYEEGVKSERERCKDLVVAHLRTNTYDGNDARIFKTTVEEVVGLLSDKK